MKGNLEIKATLPLKYEEVQLSGGIIFVGKDGVYHLPADTRLKMPMPLWEKLTVEIV